ncbi:MAG: TrbI/VirB10 family protein, partial [Pseudomonadota bacterium]
AYFNNVYIAADARKKAKMNSSIMVRSGAGPSSANAGSSTILTQNPPSISATYIGDMQRVIAQGKVIDAVLETAINTDLPGTLRAVVSNDVFSESGKNVLIPRGSRLVGTYASNVTFGITRVQIAWSRVIRPDGIDIKIASPSIDNLGRTGTEGKVDDHTLRNLSTAL